MDKILVTGTAGFIGFHLAKKLLEDGFEVIGIDCFNDYYDVRVKDKRNSILEKFENYKLYRENLANFDKTNEIIEQENPIQIIHLAAQAGVRYSLSNPWAYEHSNNMGTLNILESAKLNNIKKVVLASTSSVYGNNKKTPFCEDDVCDTQISLYAATKKANEVLAHSYHHLYGMQIGIVRFFTVYGTFGRPDLALFKFAKKMIKGESIDVYNNGDMGRDFTYVEDIVQGIQGVMNKEDLGYQIYNLGGDNPTKLMRFIELIEENLGIIANKNFMDMQAGDVKETYADVSKARNELNYNPKTKIEQGVKIFCDWFKENQNWLLELDDPKQ